MGLFFQFPVLFLLPFGLAITVQGFVGMQAQTFRGMLKHVHRGGALSSCSMATEAAGTGKARGRRKWSLLEKQEYHYNNLVEGTAADVETQGPLEVTDALLEALRLQWAYGFPYTPRSLSQLTHGYHYYPAGMQPASAAHLLQTVLPGDSVFDPFLGGGTVAVEAMRAGRAAYGSDISPLALFVSRGRAWLATEEKLERFNSAAAEVAAMADASGGGDTGDCSPMSWMAVKNAISEYLSNGCEAAEQEWLAHPLWFMYATAMSRAATTRHKKKVVASVYFQQVCEFYSKDARNLAQAAGPDCPPPVLEQRDARGGATSPPNTPSTAAVTVTDADASAGGLDSTPAAAETDAHDPVAAVLTSPPYPGVYNYLSHAREARAKFEGAGDRGGGKGKKRARQPAGAGTQDRTAAADEAGLDVTVEGAADDFVGTALPPGRDWPGGWTVGEMGGASTFRRDPRAFGDTWEHDQRAWLTEARERMRPHGRLAIMVGDGAGVDARASTVRVAEAVGGLELLGYATLTSAPQARNMRTEHMLLFEKTCGPET